MRQDYVIEKYIEWRSANYDDDSFEEFCCHIANVLICWTEYPVGKQKTKEKQELFQGFFNSLRKWIDTSNEINASKLELECIEALKFNGTIYRYLGNKDCGQRIMPVYNDIHVSWSKNQRVYNIEEKLHWIFNWMHCEMSPNQYGIDIKRFNDFFNNRFNQKAFIARGSESEIVFPTIKENIVEIQNEEWVQCNISMK